MRPYAVDELILGSADSVRVPVIGQALCAGFPSPTDDFMEGALELPRWLVPNPPATFLMQVRGESMKGAGIHDRDLACIDCSLRAEDGSVAVAVLDGQLSCKRYRIRPELRARPCRAETVEFRSGLLGSVAPGQQHGGPYGVADDWRGFESRTSINLFAVLEDDGARPG